MKLKKSIFLSGNIFSNKMQKYENFNFLKNVAYAFLPKLASFPDPDHRH